MRQTRRALWLLTAFAFAAVRYAQVMITGLQECGSCCTWCSSCCHAPSTLATLSAARRPPPPCCCVPRPRAMVTRCLCTRPLYPLSRPVHPSVACTLWPRAATGREKCARYWPAAADGKTMLTFGDIRVIALKIDVRQGYTVTTLKCTGFDSGGKASTSTPSTLSLA